MFHDVVHNTKMSSVCLIGRRGGECNHCGYIIVTISLWVCLYWCMWMYIGSGVRNPVMRSHRIVDIMVVNAAGFGIG